LDSYYSNEEIQQAVDTAEKKGLSQFMDHYPRGNRTTTGVHSTDSLHKKRINTIEGEQHQRTFFDLMMFGNLVKRTTKTFIESSDYSVEHEGRVKQVEKEKMTDNCDPCEEVREIVRGIHSGKYQLAFTGDIQEERKTFRQPHKRDKNRPTTWTTHKRNVHRTGEFNSHEVIWNGNNVQTVRLFKE
jgi:hypothetical protein